MSGHTLLRALTIFLTGLIISRRGNGQVPGSLAALGLMILAAPVFVMIIGIMILVDGGPVLFFQERTGRFGRLFRIVKFRTMSGIDGPLTTSREDPRLTRAGRVLRRFSLDELPQLLNIARGQMAFIGPRPDLQCQINAYPVTFRRIRLSVSQGVTGLAQVFGRSNLSPLQRRSLETYYVFRRSPGLNLMILLRTLARAGGGGDAW